MKYITAILENGHTVSAPDQMRTNPTDTLMKATVNGQPSPLLVAFNTKGKCVGWTAPLVSRSSPRGTPPLSLEESLRVHELGFRIGYAHPNMDAESAFVSNIDRIRRGLNESDIQFWELYQTFIDGFDDGSSAGYPGRGVAVGLLASEAVQRGLERGKTAKAGTKFLLAPKRKRK